MVFSSVKEINRLISKGILNIYLKITLTYWKKFMRKNNYLLRKTDVLETLIFYDVLKSKRQYFLLKEKVNFHKNETESKMENPTHVFREASLVLQLIWDSQIKSKTVEMELVKKKRLQILFKGNFFSICDLSQCIVYWINFQNIYTFTYQKRLLNMLFCSFLILSKAFSVSLRILKSD